MTMITVIDNGDDDEDDDNNNMALCLVDTFLLSWVLFVAIWDNCFIVVMLKPIGMNVRYGTVP